MKYGKSVPTYYIYYYGNPKSIDSYGYYLLTNCCAEIFRFNYGSIESYCSSGAQFFYFSNSSIDGN